MSRTDTPDYSGGQGRVITDEDDRYRVFVEMRHAPTLTRITSRWLHSWSVHDRIDTTSATGRLVMHILAALSQFERELTKTRFAAGLAATKPRGSQLGRRSVLTAERERAVKDMLAQRMSMYQFRSGASVHVIIGAAIGIAIGTLLMLAHFFGEAVWGWTGILLFGIPGAYFASSVIVRLAEAVVGALDRIEDLPERWGIGRR
jgi:hypothetical protein